MALVRQERILETGEKKGESRWTNDGNVL